MLISFWLHVALLQVNIQNNSMLEFVRSSILGESFASIQPYENKFKNGMFFIKNEFYAAEIAP